MTAIYSTSSAEQYLLRDKGDWRGYMALMTSGSISVPLFFRHLIHYYAGTMQKFSEVKPVNEGLLMALSVWGEPYLEKFLNYGLPSLLEPQNLAALKAAKARFFIHTDNAGMTAIASHPIAILLKEHGFIMECMLLDEVMLDMIPLSDANKYWHLGMTQSLHLAYARRLGAAYHLLMPDVVYSAGFFERLIGMKCRIVAHSSIPTDAGTIREALDKYRDGPQLIIPPADLISESLLHAHPRILPYFVQENGMWPKGHVLIMEGEHELRLMSPHETLAYLSDQAVQYAPERFYFTLDSELDKIAQGCPIYTPTKEHGLAMLEISERVSAIARSETASVEEFCKRFKQHIDSKQLMDLFLQGMDMPLNREILGDRWFMSDEKMDEMQKEVRVALSGS